jgi:hypothetical protein
MAKRSILFLAVVASLISFSAFATWNDYYYSFNHNYLGNVIGQEYNYYDATLGGGDYVLVSANPNNDTFSPAFQIQKGGIPIHPDALSYNLADSNLGHISVANWLASAQKTLLYSIRQNVDTFGYGYNDDIVMLTNGSNSLGTLDFCGDIYPTTATDVRYGSEVIIKHTEPLVQAPTIGTPLQPSSLGSPVADHTLGLVDLIPDGNGVLQGPKQRGNNLALNDFVLTTAAPAADTRLYFSAQGNYTYIFGNSTTFQYNRPGVAWKGGSGTTAYAGSDFNGNAHAADILTANYDSGSFGIFEYAWKLAGYMLGDQFWTSGLVWNNQMGYVSTSTAVGAAEAAGHLAVKNFMNYCFDIASIKVDDVNGDGKFDAATDKVLFSIGDFATREKVAYFNATWFSPVDGLKTAFGFSPDALYLYDANGVSTYMDASSGLFFGENQTTGNATVWGGKYGAYSITGFDLSTYIPEPSTMILIIGTGLALGAGILRKRMH